MKAVTIISTWAKARAKIFGSWMHGNRHVQISQGGAKDNTFHRPYPTDPADELNITHIFPIASASEDSYS